MQCLTRLSVVSTLLVAMMGSGIAEARTYRYTDENGQLVISNTVPQEAVKRGYDVLNQQGRVIQKVDPALTEEQIAEREARKQREKALKKQRELDKQLLKRFSGPDSAVRAMNRKVEELTSLIQLKRGNISVLENQLQSEQSRAADLERQGREVPDTVLRKIDRLEQQIAELETEIAAQQTDIEASREVFIKDIRRLEEITDKKRTLPLTKQANQQNTPEPSSP